MTHRVSEGLLGKSLEADSTAQRIYGKEVVTLGSLLDLSNEWTSSRLSTALCICVGFTGGDDLDDFATRLRRPVPTRRPFSSAVLKHHHLEVGADHVAWQVVDWAADQASRRLIALGLLVGPQDLDVAEITYIHESLLDAVSNAHPLPLGWRRATDFAAGASSSRVSLAVLRHEPIYGPTAWDLLGELALLASVSSDNPAIRTMAAIGALASGVRNDAVEGAAAIVWLILSRSSPEFDQLPFGSLRKNLGPAGRLIGWIGDLHMMIRVSRVGGFHISPTLMPDLTMAWPNDSYSGLALALRLARGTVAGPTNPDSHRAGARALGDLGLDTIGAWYESLPDGLARVTLSDFLYEVANLKRANSG